MRFVDANVILRYLLDDDPQFADKAAKIIEQGQVHVPFEVMAEVVYVMQGVYKVSRQKISSVLTRFIMFPNVTRIMTGRGVIRANPYWMRSKDFIGHINPG